MAHGAPASRRRGALISAPPHVTAHSECSDHFRAPARGVLRGAAGLGAGRGRGHLPRELRGAAHHWLEVEATFPGVDAAVPLRVRMSRSSPGRYSTHEFAKNLFFLEAFDGTGRRLNVTRSEPDEWAVAGHDGTVRVVYRMFGDRADGTYLGVDTTHAHLNMPARSCGRWAWICVPSA